MHLSPFNHALTLSTRKHATGRGRAALSNGNAQCLAWCWPELQSKGVLILWFEPGEIRTGTDRSGKKSVGWGERARNTWLHWKGRKPFSSSFLPRLEKPYELSKGHCHFSLLKVGMHCYRGGWIITDSVPSNISSLCPFNCWASVCTGHTQLQLLVPEDGLESSLR